LCIICNLQNDIEAAPPLQNAKVQKRDATLIYRVNILRRRLNGFVEIGERILKPPASNRVFPRL
jgi:hypothetical protein